MKTQMVITDLTCMYRGRVCIAGYDKEAPLHPPAAPHRPASPRLSLEDVYDAARTPKAHIIASTPLQT